MSKPEIETVSLVLYSVEKIDGKHHAHGVDEEGGRWLFVADPDDARVPAREALPVAVTVTVGDDAMPIDCAEAHSAAAGDLCEDGGDGCCRICGVSMTECDECEGVGYHREDCPYIERNGEGSPY